MEHKVGSPPPPRASSLSNQLEATAGLYWNDADAGMTKMHVPGVSPGIANGLVEEFERHQALVRNHQKWLAMEEALADTASGMQTALVNMATRYLTRRDHPRRYAKEKRQRERLLETNAREALFRETQIASAVLSEVESRVDQEDAADDAAGFTYSPDPASVWNRRNASNLVAELLKGRAEAAARAARDREASALPEEVGEFSGQAEEENRAGVLSGVLGTWIAEWKAHDSAARWGWRFLSPTMRAMVDVNARYRSVKRRGGGEVDEKWAASVRSWLTAAWNAATDGLDAATIDWAEVGPSYFASNPARYLTKASRESANLQPAQAKLVRELGDGPTAFVRALRHLWAFVDPLRSSGSIADVKRKCRELVGIPDAAVAAMRDGVWLSALEFRTEVQEAVPAASALRYVLPIEAVSAFHAQAVWQELWETKVTPGIAAAWAVLLCASLRGEENAELNRTAVRNLMLEQWELNAALPPNARSDPASQQQQLFPRPAELEWWEALIETHPDLSRAVAEANETKLEMEQVPFKPDRPRFESVLHRAALAVGGLPPRATRDGAQDYATWLEFSQRVADVQDLATRRAVSLQGTYFVLKHEPWRTGLPTYVQEAWARLAHAEMQAEFRPGR